ncbi:MAG: BBP7 family outer membrane beta-barrel protein [Pirellulales bacterium]
MHLKSLASLAVLLGLACEAAAQPYRPFETGVEEESGAPFEGFEYDDYNGGPPPRQGWFFNYERVVMWINAPKKTTIGKEGLTALVADGDGFRVQQNGLDTGFLDSKQAWGNRYEFGYVEGDDGWLCSILDGQPQDQLTDRTSFQSEMKLREDVDVVFEDPAFGPYGWHSLDGFVNRGRLDGVDDDLNNNGIFGRFFDGNGDGVIDPTNIADQLEPFPKDNYATPPYYDIEDLFRLPVLFATMRIRNKSYMDSVELLRTHALAPLHNGGRAEIMYGVKFIKFRDRFNVFATGGILADSYWNQLADNNIVGPEIGLRYHQSKGRWTFSGEARGLLGFNFQTLEQQGRLGSLVGLGSLAFSPGFEGFSTNRPANTPAFLDPIGFSHAFHTSVLAPGAELRFNVSYNVTADVALKAGYTGMYNYGIARASNTILYRMPDMGITTDNVRQSLWVNMFTFGFEWNR